MIEAFRSGGIMMWPLLAVAIGILALALRAAVRLARAERGSVHEVERWLQAILFWGATALVLGILGTVVGLVVMARAIGLAGAVEAPLVWGGLGVSLVTLVFGLLIFLLAALAWFTLRAWLRRSEAGREPVPA